MATICSPASPRLSYHALRRGDRDEIVVTHRGVTSRFIPVGSGLEPTLRQNRFYEATMLNYIASLRLGGTYVDVGGYIGNHALFFAQHCPAARVHTFEPSPALYPALVANVAANQLEERITAHQLGLSDRAEAVDFPFDGRQERFACERLDASSISSARTRGAASRKDSPPPTRGFSARESPPPRPRLRVVQPRPRGQR
jgi:hypothetical protein